MIKKTDSFTARAATEEKHFSGSDLLAEILPLLDEYFFGGFEQNGNVIVCKFLNGQTFYLKAEEVES